MRFWIFQTKAEKRKQLIRRLGGLAVPVVAQLLLVGFTGLVYQPSEPNQVVIDRGEVTVAEVKTKGEPDKVQVEEWITKYAQEYQVAYGLLWHIGKCESHFRAFAENGRHAGLYQFNPSTWQATRRRMGLDDSVALRFDGEEAVRTAAYKISREGSWAWADCTRLWLARS